MLGIGFKILILYSLIKILFITEKPAVCAGLYSIFSLIIVLAYSPPFLTGLLMFTFSVGLAYLYFWLVQHFEGAGALWWLIVIGGAFIGMV